MNTPPIISLKGVSLPHPRIPGAPVLSDINWDVRPGECWVITGLQGSGKTQLLETAAGLHPISGGEVRLFGEVFHGDAFDENVSIRQQFGLVFDGGGRLFPKLTVLENILLPVQYHRNLGPTEAAESVAEMIHQLDLEAIAHLRPGRINRAWSRRVALARALALKPTVLLLDNPLSGLDPTHVRWWRAALTRFVSGNTWFEGAPRTVLIASDDLRPVLPLGHRFALAHQGKWILLGDRTAVMASKDPFVQDLLNEGD